MIKKKYVLNPFTNEMDAVSVLKETIAHGDLSDMPDTGGTNTDHDARYITKQENQLFVEVMG